MTKWMVRVVWVDWGTDPREEFEYFDDEKSAYEWAEYMYECGFRCDVRKVKGRAEAAAPEGGPGEHGAQRSLDALRQK